MPSATLALASRVYHLHRLAIVFISAALLFLLTGAFCEATSSPTDRNICKTASKSSGSAFVYLISSEHPLDASVILPDDSQSYHLHFGAGGNSLNCTCCAQLPDAEAFMLEHGSSACDHDSGSQREKELVCGGDLQLIYARKERRLRQAARDQLWKFYKGAHVDESAVQYVIWMHISGSRAFTRQSLELFHTLLLKESPDVGVPFHACNVEDQHSANPAVISGVYDTDLVAIHQIASKLLMPVDEELFSIVCCVMLPNSVMQFAIHDLNGSISPACHNDDVGLQEVFFDFVSSLRSVEHIDAVPFSPRVRPPKKPGRLYFLSDGSVVTMALDERSDYECPVNCEFPYWIEHNAFECCKWTSSSSANIPLYDASAAYSRISRRFGLPRNLDTTGMSYRAVHFGHFYSDWHETYLTHPSPIFSINVLKPQVVFDDSCIQEAQSPSVISRSGPLSALKVTLVAEKMLNISSSTLFTEAKFTIRMTMSSPPLFDWHQFNYAVFGRLIHFRLNGTCRGENMTHFSAEVDPTEIELESYTDSDYQSAIPPRFFSPGKQWFEVNSNASKDSLRTFTFIRAIQIPKCFGTIIVSAAANVSFCALSSSANPCLCLTAHAGFQNILFDSKFDDRPVTARDDDATPDDLFEESSEPPQSVETWSDFSCSGANRQWTYPIHKDTNLPPISNTPMDLNSICLLQNACLINGSLTMFLPPQYSQLKSLGFFDFPRLGKPSSSPLTLQYQQFGL